jgi:regulator of replication initiation timing
MANTPKDVAYSPLPHSQTSLDRQDSPNPSRATSIDADGLLDNGSTTAGRKRKMNSMSSRGVANLTPDQLAKKRANDRQAQRAIRERTKGHIEALEQQVRDLSSQKPFLDLQAALRQNEAIRVENSELRQGLQAAMDIIQPLLAKSELPGELDRSINNFEYQAKKQRCAPYSSYTEVSRAPSAHTPVPRLGSLCPQQSDTSSSRQIIRRIHCQS